MKYYKVVKAKNKKLFSAINIGLSHNHPVRYIIGKWTVPNNKANNWLYVFTDLKIASYFGSCSKKYKLYECEIGRRQLNKLQYHEGILINSTILVNAVKLIKRIK